MVKYFSATCPHMLKKYQGEYFPNYLEIHRACFPKSMFGSWIVFESNFLWPHHNFGGLAAMFCF